MEWLEWPTKCSSNIWRELAWNSVVHLKWNNVLWDSVAFGKQIIVLCTIKCPCRKPWSSHQSQRLQQTSPHAFYWFRPFPSQSSNEITTPIQWRKAAIKNRPNRACAIFQGLPPRIKRINFSVLMYPHSNPNTTTTMKLFQKHATIRRIRTTCLWHFFSLFSGIFRLPKVELKTWTIQLYPLNVYINVDFMEIDVLFRSLFPLRRCWELNMIWLYWKSCISPYDQIPFHAWVSTLQQFSQFVIRRRSRNCNPLEWTKYSRCSIESNEERLKKITKSDTCFDYL